ncbi:phospholipase A1-IIgamma-like [Impatiens glandulifera]|uniref:phospholipase A1-IIgamma-like n=1 Tax=Impatiens glandulifera TaxID=253017 RepID=UPI001FB06DF0|nr:phospholipase A1-IIgamma-like [Impatiens glandulifera]
MPNWRAMSGEKNWEGLLSPLDEGLRNYIIHYGEMAQATYDAYDSDESSKTGGNSKYPMDKLFSDVGLAKGRANKKYTITKFLYATASVPLFDKDTNWMGYVAVSTDDGKRELGRRDIVIAWRGTSEEIEWVTDASFFLQPAPIIFGDVHDDKPEVHRGFYLIYTSNNPESTFNKTSARDQVLEEVTRLLEIYKNEEVSITVTGHSLGAALATISAIDIAKNMTSRSPVTAFAFASPRVGNSEVRDSALSINNLRILRIENKPDVVPDVPNLGYANVGQVLIMDTRKSMFLKHNLFDFFSSVGMAHNLEVYLHGVSGTVDGGEGFKKKVDRDLSLINKYDDYLKTEYGIPGSWWNKTDKAGMVQQADGSWKLIKINDKTIIISRL